MGDLVVSGATLPAQLLERASRHPSRTAYRHKRLGVWEVGTWAGYAADAAAAGLALEALGVGAGDRVAVAADNRPEWLITDLGVQGIGAVTVGIVPTSTAAEVRSVLSHAGARVVVCEDEEQLDKVLATRAELPDLVAAVVVAPRGVRVGADGFVRTWADLLTEGRQLDAGTWRAKVDALDPAATAVLVGTSAASGPPAVTELASRDLVAAGAASRAAFPATLHDEVLSYLPLSHLAERLTSLVDALAVGYVVNFGEGGTSFPQDLREVQPSRFLGTPRVWERIVATTEERMAGASLVKRSAYRWCMARGRGLAARRDAASPRAGDPALRALCWLLCHRQLRRKLGLSRVNTALSAGGPLPPPVFEWFRALGIEVRAWEQTAGAALAGAGTLVPSEVPA